MALRLATRGGGDTHPNPRVGCVIVKRKHLVGSGWHQKAGQAHAEVNALAQAGSRAKGATLYVTLEPCCHSGKTPPCTEAVIKSGIKRVVIAMPDPNPLVAGGGVKALKTAGIDVSIGVAKKRAKQLNSGFIKRMQLGMPYVTLKLAASLDGKTALSNGESQWITGPAARADVHRMRATTAAVLSSHKSVIADRARMTARRKNGKPLSRQPLRVLLDRQLSVPADAPFYREPGEVLVLTAEKDQDKHPLIPAEVIVVPTADGGRLMLDRALKLLADREINEVMVEAGAELSAAFVAQDLVDQLVVYQSPDLLGDAARGLFNLPDIQSMDDLVRFKYQTIEKLGRDLRLTLVPTKR